VLERLPLRSGVRLVDVGCGPGNYLQRLVAAVPDGRVVGMDLSPGMAREAAAAAPQAVTLAGDVTALPLPDGWADVVLAAHMLYHVPDAPAALGEVRRVLRPGGTLAAVTNGADHQRELHDALRQVTGRELWAPVARRWDLDVGYAMLRDHFEHVELERIVGELRVPAPEPVLRFVASTRGMDDDRLGDMEWDDLLAGLEEVVTAEIDRSGAFSITVESGVLVAT
jgi:ubiquinone/menaquinone biosynthesis C-methylase UbiE